MKPKLRTFLMYAGQAEEAMNFYVTVFKDAEITNIQRYGPDEAGAEGSVMLASFTLFGQELLCIDSNVEHEFTFTPAISFFIDCDSEAEIEELYSQLSAEGQVLMPLESYPFSLKFAWVADRFGVSWQLNLPGNPEG